jgi:hypothetical protein
MSNISLVRQIVLFFVYWLVQIIVAKNIDLFSVAFCFLYVGYILQLPLQIDKMLLLGIAFVLGILTDMAYDTLGINAFCSVLIAYLRPYLITLLAPAEEMYELSIRALGFTWYLQYTFILVFIHHAGLFLLQQFGFSMLMDTLIKTTASTFFTTFIVILVQYIFFSPALSNVRK